MGFQQIFKILYRLPEGLERVLKKGKSSEFNPRNYERVQSSPSAKVWSHKSIKDTVRLPKNLISGKKRKFFKNPKKFPGLKQKYFQTLTDKISSEQLTKLQKIKPFGHSKAPKKKKKCQILLIFPVLGRTTHIQFWSNYEIDQTCDIFLKR